MSHDLVIEIREEPDYIVLRLCGRLSLRTVPRVREAAVKSLFGTGRVLIDLSRLCSPHPTFVTVFPAALEVAGGWPSARLVLFGANAATRTMLRFTRILDTVPLAADLPSARALLEQRPPHVRRHRDLPLRNTAPAAARLVVRESCALWSVPQAVCEIAELVSSELVSNAVEHAHSSSRLTLTCTSSRLRISVRDYRPGPIPRPGPIEIDALRGRGLHLVAALAHTWGAHQNPDGKTIWATLSLDSRQ